MREKSKMKESVKVNMHVKIMFVYPFTDSDDGTKYCQADVGDQYGTIVMHVWGSLVDMIDKNKFVTLKNALFCLEPVDAYK